jgi:hypothetical protein
VCGGLAGLLTASASAAAAEAASVLPKGASKDSKSDSQSKAIDLDSIASIIADMAAEQTSIPQPRQDDSKRPASASRKLQLKGLGVKYQMNERTTIESGIRLGRPAIPAPNSLEPPSPTTARRAHSSSCNGSSEGDDCADVRAGKFGPGSSYGIFYLVWFDRQLDLGTSKDC